MVKRIMLFVMTAALIPYTAGAQFRMASEAERLLREDNTRAGNNLNSYEFRPIHDTKPPKGYKPVYISHYGRHGSRSNWGDRPYTSVIGTLEKAKEMGILTAGGDSLLNEARRVLASYDGMDGRLSQRGVREHAALAERMYSRYPGVFKGERNVRCVASTVQRCIISMNGFTNALVKKNTRLNIFPDTGEKFMLYIDNTNGYNSRTSGSGALLARHMREMPEDTVFVMRRLFTDPERARSLIRSVASLNSDIWNTASIAEDFDIEENLYRFLPFDAIYKRWSNLNRELYINHCNSVEYGAERVPMAESLVQDIVEKADESLATGKYAADLRFGHDWALMALCSYLGVEGVGDRLSFDEIDDKWLGFFNIPMASNLQLIFFRNKAGHVLVKFLYQEQEVRLRGLEPVEGPFYDWSTVKSNLKGYLRH